MLTSFDFSSDELKHVSGGNLEFFLGWGKNVVIKLEDVTVFKPALKV